MNNPTKVRVEPGTIMNFSAESPMKYVVSYADGTELRISLPPRGSFQLVIGNEMIPEVSTEELDWSMEAVSEDHH